MNKNKCTWLCCGVAASFIYFTNSATADVEFFVDPITFEQAIADNNLAKKGFDDFEESAVGIGGASGHNDPLNDSTANPSVFPTGLTIDNVSFQSNLNGDLGASPNPRGIDGVIVVGQGFGSDNEGVGANFFVDSFDIISGVPNPAVHRAYGLRVWSAGSSAIDVLVFDSGNNQIGNFQIPGGPGTFLGIVATGGDDIGRVNVFDLGFGSEGINEITAYIDAGPTTGACCFDDGTCDLTVEDNCNNGGGTYQGNGTSCDPNPCPIPTGACCPPGGAGQCLEDQTSADCGLIGGFYQGNGSTCSPNPCSDAMGACCFNNGSCAVRTETNCGNQGGSYLADNTVCDANPCPQRGACCSIDGSCVEQLETDCLSTGGTYAGNNTVCNPNPCPRDKECTYEGFFPPGVQTFLFVIDSGEIFGEDVEAQPGTEGYRINSVTMEIFSDAQANNTFRMHLYEDNPLDPAPAPSTRGFPLNPPVASSNNINPPGGTVVQTWDLTAEGDIAYVPGSGNFWVGLHVVTQDTPRGGWMIGPDAATCGFSDKTLTANSFPPGGWAAFAGIPPSNFQLIVNVVPAVSGGCCFTGNTCRQLSEADCDNFGGTYSGDGTDCIGTPCNVISGACCFDDGVCSVLTDGQCLTQGGVFQGGATACSGPNAVDCLVKEVVYESFIPETALYVPRNDGACWADDIETAAGSEGKRINTIIVEAATDTPAPFADYTVILYNDPAPVNVRGAAPNPAAVLEMARCTFINVGANPGILTCELNDPLVVVAGDRQHWVGLCQTQAFNRGGWAAGPPAPTTGFSDPTVNASSVDNGANWTPSGTVEPFNMQCIILVEGIPDPIGACCLNDTSCIDTTQANCETTLGGVYGANLACDAVQCPSEVLGACCFTTDGSCDDLTQTDCEGQGGVYQNDATDCDTLSDVCRTGACCNNAGVCQDLTDTDCAVQPDGVFRGYLTECDPDPSVTCPIGACCLDGGNTCAIMLVENCAAAGGVYAGDDTNCDCITEVCDRDCTADINDYSGSSIGDGGVNVDDLLDLIGQWGPCPAPGVGCCTADITPAPDGNGTVNVDDLLELIGQWGPCPTP